MDVQGQAGLQSEALSLKIKTERKKKRKNENREFSPDCQDRLGMKGLRVSSKLVITKIVIPTHR